MSDTGLAFFIEEWRGSLLALAITLVLVFGPYLFWEAVDRIKARTRANRKLTVIQPRKPL